MEPMFPGSDVAAGSCSSASAIVVAVKKRLGCANRVLMNRLFYWRVSMFVRHLHRTKDSALLRLFRVGSSRSRRLDVATLEVLCQIAERSEEDTSRFRGVNLGLVFREHAAKSISAARFLRSRNCSTARYNCHLTWNGRHEE
jgi:hypothetical protein